MTTTTQIPAAQNDAWGFFGTMNDNAEAAWPIAMTAISDATCQPLDSVRLFLDSRHGRHFADDVLNEMLRGHDPANHRRRRDALDGLDYRSPDQQGYGIPGDCPISPAL